MPGFKSLRDRLLGRGERTRPELVVQTSGPELEVRRSASGLPARAVEDQTSSVHESVDEERLHDLLREDPNDERLFAEMAAVVRRNAVEHTAGDVFKAEANAVWALAEELAHDQRAWYPLIELARLSLDDDREGAIRRLGIAAERDPSGRALLDGVLMLRAAGDPDGALSLGMGHWRPTEHPLEAGRELVSAAVDAHRLAEARRHLDALGEHPDATGVAAMRRDLERAITAAEKARRV